MGFLVFPFSCKKLVISPVTILYVAIRKCHLAPTVALVLFEFAFVGDAIGPGLLADTIHLSRAPATDVHAPVAVRECAVTIALPVFKLASVFVAVGVCHDTASVSSAIPVLSMVHGAVGVPFRDVAHKAIAFAHAFSHRAIGQRHNAQTTPLAIAVVAVKLLTIRPGVASFSVHHTLVELALIHLPIGPGKAPTPMHQAFLKRPLVLLTPRQFHDSRAVHHTVLKRAFVLLSLWSAAHHEALHEIVVELTAVECAIGGVEDTWTVLASVGPPARVPSSIGVLEFSLTRKQPRVLNRLCVLVHLNGKLSPIFLLAEILLSRIGFTDLTGSVCLAQGFLVRRLASFTLRGGIKHGRC
eukprot:m.64280 g.64280  ORF g.64280 m.64280 type:complete len:355 (-) comp8213_c0_seq1:1076-2140(-)